MDYGGVRKRGRHDAALNGNGGFKKSKQEMESFSPGIGSKSKPCTKFFSTSGCPFGEGCHFLHYVPGGLKNVFPMFNNTNNSPSLPPPSRNSGVPPSFPDGSSPPAVKSRLCSKYNSAEGCKYGDKCHFAHGEWELGKPTGPSSYEDPRSIPGRMGRQIEPQHQVMGGAPSGFGATATAKISIDASHAGAIIGKNGVNSKQICRVTGAKLSIRENEMDPNLRNIELEGSFDQINQASAMVRELIGTVQQGNFHGHGHGQGQMQGKGQGQGQMQGNLYGHGPGPGRGRGRGRGNGPGRGRGRGQGPPMNHGGGGGQSSSGASNFKTKVCENFNKGSCTFGDRCHFAHGMEELRK